MTKLQESGPQQLSATDETSQVHEETCRNVTRWIGRKVLKEVAATFVDTSVGDA
jgi:hypothetical protein